VENGGSGGWLENIQLIIPLIIIVVFSIFLRRRRRTGASGSNADIVAGFLSDLNYNVKVSESMSTGMQSNKTYRTATWRRNFGKIDFLEPKLTEELTQAFILAEDANDRIAKSKQYKSTSYLMGMQTGKIMSLMGSAKQGLETWIRENYQTQAPQRRTGLFG
jgi:hypothetical protein